MSRMHAGGGWVVVVRSDLTGLVSVHGHYSKQENADAATARLQRALGRQFAVYVAPIWKDTNDTAAWFHDQGQYAKASAV